MSGGVGGQEVDRLYRKVISGGGKVSYVEYVAPPEEPTVIEMTDEQMLTVAGALGTTLLCLYERVLPPHKRIVRKVEALKKEVLNLYQGAGHKVDNVTADWFCKAWDRTMRSMTVGIEQFEADRIRELEACLRALLLLKRERDVNGKTEVYLEMQPKVWAEAERLVTVG